MKGIVTSLIQIFKKDGKDIIDINSENINSVRGVGLTNSIDTTHISDELSYARSALAFSKHILSITDYKILEEQLL
jgi:hypothetical protein